MIPIEPKLIREIAPHPALADPWDTAAQDFVRHGKMGWVFAVLTGTEGPAYRSVGTTLALSPCGAFAGAITSGCIEADLALRAADIRRSNGVQQLRYGLGSPFFDLKLPCGGGIDVRLFALRDPDQLLALQQARKARQAVSLRLCPGGRLSLQPWRKTGPSKDAFHIGFRPKPRFLIIGQGAEPLAFAKLLRGLGHEHLVVSHEPSLKSALAHTASPYHSLEQLEALQDLAVDGATAVTLFYHDHDYEPLILRHILHSPAFYIGAQGSRATHANRCQRLAEIGLAPSQIARIHGPMGLLPSMRDPDSLALSVLAEVMAKHQAYSEP